MIANELHDGQGLGNQLWNYALLRIIAQRRNSDFAVLGRERFKGREFMDIDFGVEAPENLEHCYKERTEYLNGTDVDISRTDPALLDLTPSAKFDGNCQSAKYLAGQQENLRGWIKVKKEYEQYATGENVCIIHFRAGDYKKIKDVFLPAEYYQHAMDHIKKMNPNVTFCCVTDENDVAESMLPGVKVIGSATMNATDKAKADHHRGGPIGIDFSFLKHARYLIIPNSSFSWWAAYLNDTKKVVVAPKYWARHNVSDGYWSTSDIITDEFTYMDKEGKAFSSAECWSEKDAYEASHPDMFSTAAKRPSFLSKILRKFA